ncbi:MAG: hypothetical protein PHC98_10145 [Syntrophotalea acetylenica]|nr:hypothetical protein [Syntrophotalea acetylenica]
MKKLFFYYNTPILISNFAGHCKALEGNPGIPAHGPVLLGAGSDYGALCPGLRLAHCLSGHPDDVVQRIAVAVQVEHCGKI